MTKKITLTPALVRAASQDAANKQMRKAGRDAWNEDDFNLAAEVFGRLIQDCD